MDFKVDFPKTLGRHELNWVIVDRLTKSAYFIPVTVDYSSKQLAKFILKRY